jgi:hypothetical protein
MILGAQAPGKVGHRQVNKRKGYLERGSLLCASCGLFVRVITRSIHVAGACVTGRNVAKSSSAFRIPNTEVKTSRANDTWAQAPGKVGNRQVTNEMLSLTR